MTGYNNLSNYYQTIFLMRQVHKYSDADISEWLPFERDINIEMLISYLKEEKERAQNGN